MSEKIRLLIADDHPIFRAGLATLFSSVEWLEVVGEVESGEQAVTQALALQPDVVLMDIKMPEFNGIEATRRIVRQKPAVKVIMLTMFEDDDSILAALRAGARGYLLKGARQEEALRAIQAVVSGEAILGAQIASKIQQLLSQAKSAPLPESFPELTGREYEILALLAQRLSNTAIAEQLSLSPKTVRNHVSNILHKLHFQDRSEAILAARAAGLGDRNQDG